MKNNNKNSFVKMINDFEMLEFIFTHCDYYNSSYAYLTYRSYYHRETEIMFSCPCCQSNYELNKLHYRNGKVMCECGAVYDIKDVRPATTHSLYSSRRADAILHNQSNGTLNKYDVPTMIGQYRFYCNKCHKTHMLEQLSNTRDGKLVCICGESYEFKDVKVLLHEEGRQYIASNTYFDGEKISLSLIAYDWGVNRHNQYYFQSGNKRLTMNLETGYSYATNKGGFYKEFNQVWSRKHDGKAPVMYNTTYSGMTSFDNHCFEDARVQELYLKYAEHTNLVRLICKNEHAIREKYRIRQNKAISDYMTNYFNNKYNYKIEPLVADQHMGRINLIDFVTKNRFVNVNLNTCEKMQMFLSYLREERDFDRKYTVFGRETNLPYMDWITKNINISKSLRKKIVKDFADINHSSIYTLLDFVYVAKRFSNKENINKIYNLLVEGDTYSSRSLIHYQGDRNVIERWLTLRDESYISNCKDYEDFTNKYYILKDAMSMMRLVDDVFGQDWTKDNVTFKTEKQYHDDIQEIYHSEAYRQAKEARDKAQLMEPFKMEDSTYALESNEITIARNRYELSTIGSAMHICVGGYGPDVEKHNCRIAYIQEDGEYKACLELRMETDNKTKKVFYKLVQAKLKHNALARSNAKYNNMVVEWCRENKIDIKTSDMINNIIEGECVVHE